MSHAILLGDSIFDNARYVGGGPAVIDQVRQSLAPNWRATLLAVDGDVTSGVEVQMRGLPSDASHLIVSVGGNDALGQAALLQEEARSMAQALVRLAEVARHFEGNYQRMLRSVLQKGLPTAVCTIYYPRFPEPHLQIIASTALTVFNDAIIRVAVETGVPLLDLRLICSEHADYANEIEPSSQGGAKIASAISQVVTRHDFASRRTSVYF